VRGEQRRRLGRAALATMGLVGTKYVMGVPADGCVVMLGQVATHGAGRRRRLAGAIT
jgi:hypothetical protein